MSVDVEVKLINNSDKIIDEFNKKLKNGLFAIGATAEKHAKQVLTDTVYSQTNLPYKLTGNLRNSITHAEDVEASEVYIGTNVVYARGIELGTHRKNGPVYFLTRACTEHNDEYKKILSDSMGS